MKWQYAFEGRIVHHTVGTYRYTVVFLPPSLAEQLPFDKSGKVRFRGVLGAAAFYGAWQPVRGRWYCMLSKKVIAASGYRLAELAMVRFNVEDPDAVLVPEPLQQALDANSRATTAWRQLSPGKQRGFAHRVSSAKRPETISKRLAEVVALLEGR